MDTAPDPGWRLKPRLEKRSAVVKHDTKRRPPSYVKTQAKNPAYVRIRNICDRFDNTLNGDSAGRVGALLRGDEHAIQRAHVELCRDLRNHIALAGTSLLRTMEDAKKMVQIVAEQRARVARLVAHPIYTEWDACRTQKLFDCFPDKSSQRDYTVYYRRVLVIKREVAKETALAQTAHDKQLALEGAARVLWDTGTTDSNLSFGLLTADTQPHVHEPSMGHPAVAIRKCANT